MNQDLPRCSQPRFAQLFPHISTAVILLCRPVHSDIFFHNSDAGGQDGVAAACLHEKLNCLSEQHWNRPQMKHGPPSSFVGIQVFTTTLQARCGRQWKLTCRMTETCFSPAWAAFHLRYVSALSRFSARWVWRETTRQISYGRKKKPQTQHGQHPTHFPTKDSSNLPPPPAQYGFSFSPRPHPTFHIRSH